MNESAIEVCLQREPLVAEINNGIGLDGAAGRCLEHDRDAVQEGCGTGGGQRRGTTDFGRIRNQLRKER